MAETVPEAAPPAFGGVIGDDWRESTPWWPPEPAPPAGAPNVVARRARRRRLRAARLLRLRHRDTDHRPARGRRRAPRQLPHHRAVLADAVVPAHRAQPSLATAWAGSPTSPSATPATAGAIPRENGFLPEILAANGYATYAVGKWHLTPEDETHMAAPRGSWPLGRGFERWYGFHGGETHQFVPTLYHDNHAVAPAAAPRRRLPPERRPRRPRDRVPRRPPRGRRRAAVLPATSRPARATRRTTRRPEWIERYRGQFDDGLGRVARARPSRASSTMGLLPAGTELSPRPHWVPAWDDLEPDDQRVAARFMECFAAYLSYADAQIGRVLDFLDDELGELDNTLVVLVLRQRRERRGRRAAARSTTSASGTACPPAGASCARASTSSAARPRTTTTRGAGRWPATRRSSAGSARCTKAASPIRASSAGRDGIAARGRDPPPVRARDRRRSRRCSSSSASTRPTSIDGVAQSPIDGTSFAGCLADGAGAGAHTTRSTSRCSAAAASTTTAGRR